MEAVVFENILSMKLLLLFYYSYINSLNLFLGHMENQIIFVYPKNAYKGIKLTRYYYGKWTNKHV